MHMNDEHVTELSHFRLLELRPDSFSLCFPSRVLLFYPISQTIKSTPSYTFHNHRIRPQVEDRCHMIRSHRPVVLDRQLAVRQHCHRSLAMSVRLCKEVVQRASTIAVICTLSNGSSNGSSDDGSREGEERDDELHDVGCRDCVLCDGVVGSLRILSVLPAALRTCSTRLIYGSRTVAARSTMAPLLIARNICALYWLAPPGRPVAWKVTTQAVSRRR